MMRFPFRKRFLKAFLPIFFLVFAGCAGPGVYHRVGKNETFWRICRTYGVDMQEVAELNNIKDPTEIKAGSRIFIPGVSKVRKVTPYAPPRPSSMVKSGAGERVEEAQRAEEEEGKILVEKDRFSWPVKGEIISPFGVRDGVRHGGIDIKAKDGTSIKAADSGEVVYVNTGMRGYGNIVILKHKDDFYTVYAHNKENHVSMGESIAKGSVIGTVGDSGNASTAHLHFEVRQGRTVRNPLFFLP